MLLTVVHNRHLLSTASERHRFAEAEDFAARVVAFVSNLSRDSVKLQAQLHDSAEGQRMDLKFHHLATKVIVTVQYEPGYPVPYFDEDLWN
jgi:hypothetical protein